MPPYRSLEPGDDFYSMAAWAYHHQHELDPVARRGLFVALRRDWPCTQGEPARGGFRRILAGKLAGAGVSVDIIAEEFAVAPDTVKRWVRARRQIEDEWLRGEHDGLPYVVKSTDNPEHEPPDPASEDELVAVSSPPPYLARAREDAWQRAFRAARRGGLTMFAQVQLDELDD